MRVARLGVLGIGVKGRFWAVKMGASGLSDGIRRAEVGHSVLFLAIRPGKPCHSLTKTGITLARCGPTGRAEAIRWSEIGAAGLSAAGELPEGEPTRQVKTGPCFQVNGTDRTDAPDWRPTLRGIGFSVVRGCMAGVLAWARLGDWLRREIPQRKAGTEGD